MDSYNWYPGHMTKSRRAMQESIKLVDLVIELVDARAPLSTKNPDIESMANGKARLILLNKADLSDSLENARWIDYFKSIGIYATALNSKGGEGIKTIDSAVSKACRERIEKNKRKGIISRPMRAMVAGIPNVGKSTFINKYTKKAVTKTGNRPGVTRGEQWIRLGKTLELLDTPGILWPKIEDRQSGFNLALIGSINDEILNLEELSITFLERLLASYPLSLLERYDIKGDMEPLAALQQIAKSRGALKSAGELDTAKASRFFIDDFRAGRLGRITLESAPERIYL